MAKKDAAALKWISMFGWKETAERMLLSVAAKSKKKLMEQVLFWEISSGNGRKQLRLKNEARKDQKD